MLLLLLSVILNLNADFRQEKEISIMSETQVSTGHLTYKAPDYLRWEYTTPTALVWEVDGKKGNVSPQVRRMIELIMRSISGEYLTTNDDFLVEQQGAVYTLVPKKREIKQLFTSIVITLDPSTGVAKEVVMTEKNGDTTRIRFSNVRL